MTKPLVALLLGCFLLAGSTQAQQSDTKSLVYTVRLVTICDTRPSQTIWLVDKTPNVAYKSLDAPSFLQWVSGLPKGTEIDYRSRTEGLPYLSGLFKGHNDPEEGKKLQAFGAFCHSRGLIFAYRFPVL